MREHKKLSFIQKQPPEVFFKKRSSQKFRKTHRKTRQTLFLIKLQTSDLQLFKKETLTQVFCYEFCEISKNTFFREHRWWLLLFFYLNGSSCHPSSHVIQKILKEEFIRSIFIFSEIFHERCPCFAPEFAQCGS